MSKLRLILLSTPRLLGEGLEYLLSGLEEVEYQVLPLDLEAAHSSFQVFNPDLLLVVENAGCSDEAASFVGCLLENYPGLPVLRVSLEHKDLRLFTSRSLPASRQKLVEAIQSLEIQPRQE